MIYKVLLTLEAVEDVLRITLASPSKAAIIEASQQIQQLLQRDPHAAGTHLSEGLYFLDCGPLRAFFIVDENAATVEIVNVRGL